MIPNDRMASWNHGIFYKHNNLYAKVLFSALQLGRITGEGTWLVNDQLLVGDSLDVDAKEQKIRKYEAGLVWEPKDDVNVGLKHEFSTK